jgi:LysR family transcriptional regulator for metE and metH
MVKANMGVMAMAKWASKPYLANKELQAVKIGKSGLKRKHYIAFMNTKKQPAYFNQFIEFLKAEINSQWNTE